MEFNSRNINRFLFFKLPSAYWSGVRVKAINEESCEVTVRFKWFNQNPFKSMYFAIQAMAAELSTGALVMREIQRSGKKVSMLVANNNGTYTKKAVGKITFTCDEARKVKEAIEKSIHTKESQQFWLKSTGIDEQGDQVSVMNFEWTVKAK